MSRGPGRWQRALIEAAEESERDGYLWATVAGTVRDQLGHEPTRTELVAARRAAATLAAAGRVRTIYVMWCRVCGVSYMNFSHRCPEGCKSRTIHQLAVTIAPWSRTHLDYQADLSVAFVRFPARFSTSNT